MQSTDHLGTSRQLVYDELKSNPGELYRRGSPKLLELAAEHRLSPNTLNQALWDLATKGRILRERVGRSVVYFYGEGDDSQSENPVQITSEVNKLRRPQRYTVTYVEDEDGYIGASVPSLPGCHSQGRSREEARRNIREAMQGYLASLEYRGVPLPKEDVEHVEVLA